MRWVHCLLCCCLALPAWAQPKTEVITIVRDDAQYPPLEYLQDGELTGLHIELVTAVAQQLGMKIEWIQAPWRRALLMVQTGEADAITYIANTPERRQWAIYEPDNVLSSGAFSFLTHKDFADSIKSSHDINTLLANYDLLVVSGFNIPKVVRDAKPKLFAAPKLDNLVKMIATKRHKLALVSQGAYLGKYADTQASASLHLVEPAIYSFANYIAFSRNNQRPDLAQDFAREMAKFKQTDAYQTLVERFSE
ncbi:hypothetical protein GCM10011297_34660 [Bacterioplanes sanyensis]|uniref:substrate-binding periplasmic protein n=1 Tax=Bacterioplanes sanyensis TaxID=1249553 RepID=UPI0016746967|nr:transporter substrate-binding domain-containing protein [Bacterioplanes sanyensis]GGY59101.1 hypothetical protein GCM10011297_34660 [Bacterioplanes sanyensis]